MSDDYSDIDPITINSEKELTLEFDNFSKILVDTAKDWNQRLSAIKRLEGIIIGGGFEFEGFPALLTKLYLHINAQVNDLRSAISKEACRLVCIAAEYGQEYTENLCDKLLSKQCLIKVINSATKIISENGHECIMCLLRNSKTPKVIPKIIEEASSKSVAVRQKISQYLYIVVELFEEPILEKYMNILEEAINSLIGDANKEVRQVTRQTFGMYADKFPPRAAKMFPAFDPSVQKTLVDEGLVDPSAYMKKALSINTKEGKSTQRPSSVSAKKNVQSAGKMGETFNFANSDKLVKSPEFEKKSATLPRSGSNEDNKTAPKRSRPSERQGIEKKSPESGGLGGTSYAPGLKGHMTLAHAKSLPEDTSKLMKSMTSKGIASQRIPAKELASKQHESINISRNESRNESDREVAYRSQEGEDLSILLENTDNEDWATRANAFEQINEYVANLQPHEQPSYSTMDDLVEAHIKHLNDYHYKVVVSCQESFSRLITIYHSKVLPYLDRIIPPLFVNLTEGKDKVISSTNFLINLINKIYSGDEMIPHFLKSLDSYSKIKYKTSVVEFMNILIRNCQNYFNSQAAIKTCVSKFAAIIGEFTSTKSIVMPCLGMILYLRDINLTATITAIGSLDMNLMSKVRALAVEYAPDLEENLQVYLLQAKGNGKPEVRSSMSVTNSTSISSSKSNSLSNTGTTFTKKQDGIAENQISYQEEVIPTKKTFSEKVNENNDKGLGSTLKGNKSSRIGPGVTSPSVRSPVENSIPKTKVPQQNIQIDRIPETVNNKSNGSTPVYTDVDDFLQAESNALSEIGKEVPKETQQILSELVKIDSLISDFPKKKDEIQKRLENITATLSIPTLSNDQKAFDYSLSILANLLKLPLDFSKHIEALISGIVSLYANTPKGNHTIDEILRTALQLGPADTALRALLINLEEADSPIAQILIKNITKLGLQCPQSSLLKIMPPLVARYKELINHSNPDVRKNVVFSIVDFYLVNPQELQKYINDFSANHQKLIGIYIQKKSEGHSTEPDKRITFKSEADLYRFCN